LQQNALPRAVIGRRLFRLERSEPEDVLALARVVVRVLNERRPAPPAQVDKGVFEEVGEVAVEAPADDGAGGEPRFKRVRPMAMGRSSRACGEASPSCEGARRATADRSRAVNEVSSSLMCI